MEKCARFVTDGVNITEFLKEIPCDPEVITQLPHWTMYIWYGLGAITLITLFFGTFYIVQQKTVTIIERFGRFKRIAYPGLNVKIPFLDREAGKLSLQIRELFEEVNAKSKDNAFVKVPVKVQYQVSKNKEYEAFYELENAQEQMKSYIVNVVRSAASGMDMEQLFSSKTVFEDVVEKELNQRFGDYGFTIINVLVDDPQPSSSVVASFNAVIASLREKEAAQNEAEALRIKTVAEAKAEAESLELKAQAYVNQREIVAKGIEGLGLSKEQLVSFLERIDWRDTVRDASRNKASVIMIPSDMKFTSDDVAKIKAITKQ